VQKGFPVDDVESALARLTEKGLLDDLQAAASLVRARSGRGRSRISAELASKGVSREDANAALLSELAPEDEKMSLRRALEKKARTLPPGLTPGERSKKLFGHLVRRGFPPGAVLEALRKDVDADDEP
jgi:regulatory protein